MPLGQLSELGQEPLELELELLELLELLPETVILKFWLHEPLWAVAVHELVGYTVCSRDEPDVPQPLQLHEPPLTG